MRLPLIEVDDPDRVREAVKQRREYHKQKKAKRLAERLQRNIPKTCMTRL